MSTTAFQWVFNNAASISMNCRAVVAQTQSRDQTLRTVSRGGQVWRFEIAMPEGQVWTTARPYIEAINAADRFTTGTVQINNSGYNSWLTKYQGAESSYTGWTATWTRGAPGITITGGVGYPPVQPILRAGDLVQLGSGGHVYSVKQDASSLGVTLNRPVLQSSGSGTLLIGPNVTWTVLCTELPDYEIFDVNLVRFKGTFKFQEYITV